LQLGSWMMGEVLFHQRQQVRTPDRYSGMVKICCC
jgi:hypothetical protein